jgi:hypothetical protein
MSMRLSRPLLCTLLAISLIGICRADDGSSIEQPQMGSYLKRTVFEGSLPRYKTYAELGQEEKDMLKSAYENMPDKDEPPYPEYGMQEIWTPLSKLHQLMVRDGILVRGNFYALVRVDGTGKGRSISILETPDTDFNKPAAIVLLKKVKYKPAMCNGAPCVMDFPVRIEFEIVPAP